MTSESCLIVHSELACAGAGGNSDWPVSGPALPESSAASRSSLPQGAGPRIYVGGIPNAVSETMVRKYFANWGKVGLCCVMRPLLIAQVASCL